MLSYPLYNGYKLMIKRPACKKKKNKKPQNQQKPKGQKLLSTSNCMAPSRGPARDLQQLTHTRVNSTEELFAKIMFAAEKLQHVKLFYLSIPTLLHWANTPQQSPLIGTFTYATKQTL